MQTGIFAILIAYTWWGLSPLYWGEITMTDPIHVIAHRAFWTLPVAFAVVAWQGRVGHTLALMRQPKVILAISVGAFLVSFNGILFVWSVGNGKLADSSLGYFILPLVNVGFGMLLFRERPDKSEMIAILFAMAGIGVLLTDFSHFPWIALGIAFSFGIYGLIRKTVLLDSTGGMFAESLILAPFAGMWIWWFDGAGLGMVNGYVDSLLLLAGLFTAIPMMAYAAAARKLTMITVGLLFYLNPGLQILLAIVYFNEEIPTLKLLAFGLVWTGLAILSLGKIRQRQAVA